MLARTREESPIFPDRIQIADESSYRSDRSGSCIFEYFRIRIEIEDAGRLEGCSTCEMGFRETRYWSQDEIKTYNKKISVLVYSTESSARAHISFMRVRLTQYTHGCNMLRTDLDFLGVFPISECRSRGVTFSQMEKTSIHVPDKTMYRAPPGITRRLERGL